VSYSAVLRSIFGIDSEFDVDTEKLFNDFHAAKSELLSDASSDRAKVDEIAKKLKERSEEAAALVGIELRLNTPKQSRPIMRPNARLIPPIRSGGLNEMVNRCMMSCVMPPAR
jgi:hypothetical protein